jgi:hypothetical protein
MAMGYSLDDSHAARLGMGGGSNLHCNRSDGLSESMTSFTNKKDLKFIITLGTGTFGSSSNNTITLQGYRASVNIDKAGGMMMGTLKAQIYGVSQSDMTSITTLQWHPKAFKRRCDDQRLCDVIHSDAGIRHRDGQQCGRLHCEQHLPLQHKELRGERYGGFALPRNGYRRNKFCHKFDVGHRRQHRLLVDFSKLRCT